MKRTTFTKPRALSLLGVLIATSLMVGLRSIALGGVTTTTAPPSCGNGSVTPPETCDPPGSVQFNGNVCRKDCTFCGDGIVNDGEQCDHGVNNGTPGDSCSPGCTTCPGSLCANPALESASGCTVLELDGGSVSMTGPAGGIQGDVCIGPNGKLDMSGSQFVNGNLRLAQGATFSRSGSTTVGSVETNQDLSAEINDALAAASSAAAETCTQRPGSLMGNNTIVGTGGANVICVTDIVLQAGQIITVQGTSSDTFVFNVTGKFVINGGRIIANGVRARDILYNIIGSGADVAFTGGGGGTGCCNASVDGTVLAPSRKIALSPGLVNGDIVSGLDISIVSGASVQCPPPPPCPPSTTTTSVTSTSTSIRPTTTSSTVVKTSSTSTTLCPCVCGTTTTTTLPSGSCSSPFTVPAGGGTLTGTTSGASAASSSTCASDANSATANSPEEVFEWTPMTSGTATIATCGAGTTFDTVLYVRSGSCKGSEVACNDDTPGCATGDSCSPNNGHHGSSVNVNVTAGVSYFIFVDGFASSCGGDRGKFTLTVTAP